MLSIKVTSVFEFYVRGKKGTPNGTRSRCATHLSLVVETGVKATFSFLFFFFLNTNGENGFKKIYFQLLVTEEEEDEDVICYLNS